MKNTEITTEVHPFGITTRIPFTTLVKALDRLLPDELEDLLTLEEQIQHLKYFLAESSAPLLHFSIFSHHPNTLTINQLFSATPPAHHRQLLLHKLNHHIEIVSTASEILDTYTELLYFDLQARLDFKAKSYIKAQRSTEYFIKFMEHAGDDTAFDYHGTYTITVLETIIEALSPSS